MVGRRVHSIQTSNVPCMQQSKQRTTQQFKQAMPLGLSAVSRVLTGTCACVVSRKLPGNSAGASVGARTAGQTHVRVLLLRLLSDYSDLASWLAWWASALGYLHRAQQLRQVPRNIPGNFPEASARTWRGRSGGRGRVHREGQGGCTGCRRACCGLVLPGRVVDGGLDCDCPIWPRV
jgi:hypothetical protein